MIIFIPYIRHANVYANIERDNFRNERRERKGGRMNKRQNGWHWLVEFDVLDCQSVFKVLL